MLRVICQSNGAFKYAYYDITPKIVKDFKLDVM